MKGYTINSIKRAEVMDEMPISPNQQGLGFGPYLDNEHPNDGESLVAIERSFPKPTGWKAIKIRKPSDKSTIAFEDLLRVSEEFEDLIRFLVDESQGETLEKSLAEQFKHFPRVNWSL